MKVIVNIPQDAIVDYQSWVAVQGFELIETQDGSFDLKLTQDLAEAQATDEEVRRMLAGEPS